MSNTTTLQEDAAKVRIVSTALNTLASFARYNYMRPNLANNGNLPAGGPYNSCPDIWPTGTTPLKDYTTVLASQPSYRSMPSEQVMLNMTNYIYVRAFNGTYTTQTNSVTLYYAPLNLVQYPGAWQNNVIKTDQGNSSALITIPPNTVGVADATFIWPTVPPPTGSSGYGLIAQFNDAQNSNPFPNPGNPLDMGALISNNLQWGWNNITLMGSPADFMYSFSMSMIIPDSYPTASAYTLFVTCVNLQGFQVSFQCSQYDSHDNPIALQITNITNNNFTAGVPNIVLNPGYDATVTVYVYNPQRLTPAQGAQVSLSMVYQVNDQQEFEKAVSMNLVDWPLTNAYSTQDGAPSAMVHIGAVTGVLPR